jgi:hypothetical protein
MPAAIESPPCMHASSFHLIPQALQPVSPIPRCQSARLGDPAGYVLCLEVTFSSMLLPTVGHSQTCNRDETRTFQRLLQAPYISMISNVGKSHRGGDFKGEARWRFAY